MGEKKIIYKKGEIWVMTSRLTSDYFVGKLLEDVIKGSDSFFDVEIIEGKKYWLGSRATLVKGDKVNFRESLTTFKKRLSG